MFILFKLCASIMIGICVYGVARKVQIIMFARARRFHFEMRLVRGPDKNRLQAARDLAMNRFLAMKTVKALVSRLSNAGFEKPSVIAVYVVAIFPIFVVVLIGVLGSMVKAGVVIVLAYLSTNFWIKKRSSNHLEKFTEQLPMVLKLTAGALAAGSSIQQAIILAGNQIGPPAREELRVLTEQITLGLSLDKALDHLYQKFPVTELKMMIMGLSIQRRIGGNLVSMLQETTAIIEERRSLQKNLIIETAQPRLSAKVIGSLPVIVVGVMLLIDPSFMSPLFHKTSGLVLLAIAILAETAGFLMLRQIMDIKI